ncbi:MAG: toll/interleukin-1 receptor domain-containing protein [Saprospiraceae bacterium]
MKSKIFISHAGKDRALALQLSSLLHEKGAETWTDADLPAGEDWAGGLRKALQQANMVLLLLSKNYKKTDNSLFELGAAIGLNKKILPVAMTDGVGNMHGIFEKSQVVNGKKLGRDKLVEVVMAAAGGDK